jgi:hypothetical protein
MRRPEASKIFNGVVLAAATALGLSCHGGLETQGVTGPTSTADLTALEDTGTFEASGRDDQVLVCHKGRDLLVATSAVPAHLAHGDTLGSCQPAGCPCFTADQVAAAAACPGAATLCFQSGGQYLCEIQCPTATYDYFLAPDRCDGPQVDSPIDASQFQACFDVLRSECPSFVAL